MDIISHDVFISYSSSDKAIADAICHRLEEDGITCWIAPRDVIPGPSFEGQIVRAIKGCTVMVLIISPRSNSSEHVGNEIAQAFKAKKIIIPFVVEQTDINENLDYYLSSKHWLVAYPDYREKTTDLTNTVLHLLGRLPASDAAIVELSQSEEDTRGNAEIHIETDSYCSVHCFNKYILTAKPGEDNIIVLKQGRHRVIISSELFPDIQETQIIDIPNNSFTDFITIKFRLKEFERVVHHINYPVKIGQYVGGFYIEKRLDFALSKNVYLISRAKQLFKLIEFSDPIEGGDAFQKFYKNQQHLFSCLQRFKYNADKGISYFISSGHLYVITEYIHGVSLDDWMMDVIDVSLRFSMAIKLCHLLQSIHDLGVVCQDFTPSHNIIVSNAAGDPYPYITSTEWAIPSGLPYARLVGTPWYANVDDKPSEKSDIFSLGIIVSELVTGANPFQAKNESFTSFAQWTQWVKEKSYVYPLDLNPDDVTSELNELLVRCFSFNPEDRPSIKELCDCLERVSMAKTLQ